MAPHRTRTKTQPQTGTAPEKPPKNAAQNRHRARGKRNKNELKI